MLIQTYSAAYALWNQPWAQGEFECDVDRLSRLIRGKLRMPPRRLLISPSARELKDLSHNREFISVDIETGAAVKGQESWTGLDPTRARLKCVGFGTEEEGCSIWWDGINEEIEEAIKEILAGPITKVFHNGFYFDLRVMERCGLRVRNIMDTRDLRRAISSTSPLSLRYLASLHDDVEAWKENEEDDEKGIIFTEVANDLMRYNAMDCVVTARCYAAMLREPEWAEPRTKKLYQVHSELSRIAAEMHTAGIYVHKRNREYMMFCQQQEIEECKEKFLALVGIKDMRCNANDLRSLIYKRHETARVTRFSLPDPYSEKMYTDESLTKISVDGASLLSLITSGECSTELVKIIDAYWVTESAKKQLSMLKSSKIDQAISDGRLRPGWNSCGTDTMRFSCSKPNVMQIPQMLRAYMGPAPGKVIVHADKSSMELRVMAAIADDGVLQKRLDNGDVYGEDAKDWFGLPRDMNVKKAKPQARQACKIIHLASQYSAGVATIHSQALESDRSFKFETTRLLNNGFKRTYAATCAYWQEEQKRVLACGYSEGRLLQGRRYYPKPPPITEIANWPVQRTASEMMCLEMLALHKALQVGVPSARIIIILHDAFDVECAERDEARVIEVMQEVMDRKYTIDGRERSFPVEIKVSRYSDSLDNGFGALAMQGSWADV